MDFKSLLLIALIGVACVAGEAHAGPSSGALQPAAMKPSGIAWKEGENYELVTAAPRTMPAPGKVEVIEFFQYGCPHCYTLEPHLVFWKRMYANLATVTRVPVAYKPAQRRLARLYYTLEALGRIDSPGRDDLHHEVFDQVHRLGVPIISVDEQEDFRTQLEFAVASGIDAARFTEIYRSAGVEEKVKRAEELAKAYRITGTPMFIVGGKFRTDVSKAGNEYRLLSLLADLALRSAPQPK
jgi:protein dithiol oxidoreductase (disulfide-forming)